MTTDPKDAEIAQLTAANNALKGSLTVLDDGYRRVEAERDAALVQVARLHHLIREASDPDFLWGAMDNVNDMDVSLTDFAEAASRAIRASVAAASPADHSTPPPGTTSGCNTEAGAGESVEAPAHEEPVAWQQRLASGEWGTILHGSDKPIGESRPLFAHPPTDAAEIERLREVMADDAAEIERLRKAIHDNNRSTIVRIAEATEARMKAEARVAELEVALRARPVGPKWRHIKRGSIYTEIGRGKVQTDTPLTDYAEVVVYQADDGSIWVRPVSEFEDGRFAALTPNTAQEDRPHDR